MHSQRWFPEISFGGFSRIDGTVAFYTRVNALVASDSVLVDFGCGRGGCADDAVEYRRRLQIFKGRVHRVVGLDVDETAAGNPCLDEFRLLRSGHPWPVEDRSVDVVLADCVLEHLADPDAFFAEARRVLRPGNGYLCIRTPNAWSYISLAARLIPNRFHAAVLAYAQSHRKAHDVFPVIYRCNTIPALRRIMKRHGFAAAVYGFESEPQYLNFSRFFYALGVLHQKLAPEFLRPAIFAFGRLGG